MEQLGRIVHIEVLNMRCCLCKKEIRIKNGWSEGNNAQPLKDGRCCDKCNIKVIQARMRKINAHTI